MPLIVRNGKLLVNNGKLITNPNCCCEDCPDCCASIDEGLFNDDGDLEILLADGSEEMLITFVMPTKNSRYICDGDQLTIEVDFTGTPAEQEIAPLINFGPVWTYGSETPAATFVDRGVDDQGGVVDWYESTATSYSLTLTFRKCFLSSATDLAYLRILARSLSLVEIIHPNKCGTSQCCTSQPPCENCCIILLEDPNAAQPAIPYNDKFYYYDHQDFFLLTANVDKKKVCIDEELTVSIRFIPDQYYPTFTKPYLYASHYDWSDVGHDPPVAIDGSFSDDETHWGGVEDTEDTTYTLALTFSGDYDETEEGCKPPQEIILGVPDSGFTTIPEAIPSLGILISHEVCDLTGCCPPPVCNCCEGPVVFNVVSDLINNVNGQQSWQISVSPTENFCEWSGTLVNTIDYFDSEGMLTQATITIEVTYRCEGDNIIIEITATWTHPVNGLVEYTLICTVDLSALQGCNQVACSASNGWQISVQLLG